VIVRLMGEGQYRVDDDLRDRLSELDDLAGAAADSRTTSSPRPMLSSPRAT
jgi:hypothetical protein